MPRQALTGFTLVELMITLLVIGVLAAIAVPSFADLLERNRVVGTAQSVKSELLHARSEAIKRSCEVEVTVGSGSVWTLNTIYCGDSDDSSSLSSPEDSVDISTHNYSDNTLSFRFRRGEADQPDANLTLSSDKYDVAVIVVDGYAIELCTPADSAPIPGISSCS